MKTASEAMGQLPCLIDQIDHMRSNLADLCEELGLEWEQLGKFGYQRDDHAVCYLKRLLSQLVDFSNFLDRCCIQAEKLIADPFGEKE